MFKIDLISKSFICDTANLNEKKQVEYQLLDIGVHTTRRSFEASHSKNTFKRGYKNSLGLEVIVGGKMMVTDIGSRTM